MVNLLKIKLNILYIALFFITFSTKGFDLSTALSIVFIPFINYKRVIMNIKKSNIYKLVFIFYVLCIISISINIKELNQNFRFFSTFLMFLFITSNNLFNENLFKKYIKIIIYGLIIQNIIVLYLVFVQGVFEIPGFKPFYSSFRYSGFYSSTILSIFLSLILIIFIDDYTIFKNRILKLFIIIVLFYCIILSLTRSSWITLSFGLALIFYTRTNFKSLKFFHKIAIFTIVIFVGLILLVSYKNQINNFDLIIKVSDRISEDTFNTSSDDEKDRGNFIYPLTLIDKIGISTFGIGLGQSEKRGGEIFDLAYQNDVTSLGTHNTFAHILLDFGVLAFFSFLGFNVLILRYFLKNYKILKSKFIFGCFISYFSIFIASMFQDLIIYLPISIIPIFCISFITNEKYNSKKIYN